MKIWAEPVAVPGDGEIQEFSLFTVDELERAVGNGEFTPANGYVALNFLIRHGIIGYENRGDYWFVG